MECQRRFHSCGSENNLSRAATPTPVQHASSGAWTEADWERLGGLGHDIAGTAAARHAHPIPSVLLFNILMGKVL